MSPAEMSILIHCHALAKPLSESVVTSDTIKWFLAEGIIEHDGREHSSGFKTTERGRKWLEMCLETPMPIMRWVDPRTIQKENTP